MKNISVIGSGQMGNGIAHVFAQNGFKVMLIDIKEDALARAVQTISNNLDRQLSKGLISEDVKSQTLGNIETTTDMKAGVANADLVVEAATENIDLKLFIFKGSAIASVISIELIKTVRGMPVVPSRPRISICFISFSPCFTAFPI